MKRIVSILLTVALLLGMAMIPAAAEEKVTLKVVTNGNIQSFFEGEDENHNYMIDYIESNTGYDVEWYILPTEGREEKLNAMMSSAEQVPDIIMTSNRNEFLSFYSDEMIVDLTDAIGDAATYFQYDEVGAYKLGILDGKYYAVSTPGNQSATNLVWWYNVAALEAAGIEVPGHELTLDQFTDILYKMQAAYPDKVILGAAGNGNAMVGGMVSGMEELYGAFGIANEYRIGADGKLEYSFATDDAKAALTYLNKLYTDGILDKEFMVTTKDTMTAKLVNGDVLSGMFQWYDYTGTYKKNLETQDENKKWSDCNWSYDNIIDGGYMTKGQTNGSLNQYYMMVSYNCKHVEEAVKVMQLMLTPEYYDKVFFGTEGTDYYYDANGQRWRNQDTQIGKGFSVSGTQWYVYYYFTESAKQRVDRLGTGNPYYPYEYNMNCWYDAKRVDNPLAVMPAIQEYIDTNPDLKDVVDSYAIKFVTGEYSFDKWDAFVAELNSVGLAEVLDVLNAWYETL